MTHPHMSEMQGLHLSVMQLEARCKLLENIVQDAEGRLEVSPPSRCTLAASIVQIGTNAFRGASKILVRHAFSFHISVGSAHLLLIS